MDPRTRADAEYRRAWGTKGRRPWGRPLRAAFYAELPDSPRGPHVSREDCQRYLARIRDVAEMHCWTRAERKRLKVLEQRWARRARGEDARFNALGVQGGVNERFRVKSKLEQLREITHGQH